ncbi:MULTISPECIES: GNAT family N-acetyltransferase [Chryseobacterium]|uniref:GNAT superfamily N-acetyltransferase n=1 Tax=Chryseobacterium camelliae TaxID=1265445 RepID=A0ABU0TGL7_9FLAO|nr:MULTISPECIES: GNAT family N-acetyltransferase [Chryseobacterium]MDT3406924.1 GNAT superfamily N-acetyltransferase [Pseudacidovorax intermedius]MDQ1095283.1 GNAT superfamily N-acetyltransferase [Chryseobacterium camelliae]MDQ1099222.1 GNAT superfamily N-acetyltransferase [Chryseobacterium sp. SORGH_AS_1048]MDR6086571.1 GNAT superfamily N-acetyltransferase [Chryseobacterium sp. SORGH_AS_0909]MDR6130941.1 GNAT superfamily N-acetyltransferase [Chryseobacterium sp. SORGH_AS_1175]
MTRKATLQDIGQLSELFDQYRIFYHKTSDVPAAEQFLTERIENGDSKIFVAEIEERLVGFVQLYPLFSSTRMKRYWLLNDLFVNESYRGKGFSKKLIEQAKEMAQSTDACGILLETGKSNDIGNKLYPSCGFELYDEVNFYEWTNYKD